MPFFCLFRDACGLGWTHGAFLAFSRRRGVAIASARRDDLIVAGALSFRCNVRTSPSCSRKNVAKLICRVAQLPGMHCRPATSPPIGHSALRVEFCERSQQAGFQSRASIDRHSVSARAVKSWPLSYLSPDVHNVSRNLVTVVS
jgi:hypothetical protein